MSSENEIIEIHYNELDYNVLFKYNNRTLRIIKDSIDYYIFINLKENVDKAVVFSSGTYDPAKSTPPIFMRRSWSDDYESHCIYVDDRTLHDYPDLRVAYGIGTPEKHYLYETSLIIQKILLCLYIDDSNVIYFGSSSGGFMSIAFAIYHKNSRAIVNNARLFVDRSSTSETIYKTIFSNLSREDILSQYESRLSILDLILEQNYKPNITLFMNRQSSSDYTKNYGHFINQAKAHSLTLENFNVFFYNNYDKAHDILSRQNVKSLLNGALNDYLPILP